jgi:hypothetical protein
LTNDIFYDNLNCILTINIRRPPMSSKKDKIIKEILSCTDMLQGSIVRINSRCGKKGCRCERGEYHGVSHYLSYKENGRTQMVYIPKSLVSEIENRVELFKRYWDLGVKLARLNLKEFKGKRKQ